MMNHKGPTIPNLQVESKKRIKDVTIFMILILEKAPKLDSAVGSDVSKGH